ncbi:hypothetical protein [Streptomyces sp. NPDC050988]|uniref:hypothetical protein n=1 Tax=Streptomyces sp. NPDC050988 TaxID=3365637 RepID=UPI0037A5213E
MGLVYGYDIYLRPRNVARALANLAELAAPDRAVPPLEVTLPGGDRLVLPFTSHFESEPVDCSSSSTLELDTSLMFDVDDALREYARPNGPQPEADGRIRIGYIYATLPLPVPGKGSVPEALSSPIVPPDALTQPRCDLSHAVPQEKECHGSPPRHT